MVAPLGFAILLLISALSKQKIPDGISSRPKGDNKNDLVFNQEKKGSYSPSLPFGFFQSQLFKLLLVDFCR